MLCTYTLDENKMLGEAVIIFFLYVSICLQVKLLNLHCYVRCGVYFSLWHNEKSIVVQFGPRIHNYDYSTILVCQEVNQFEQNNWFFSISLGT